MVSGGLHRSMLVSCDFCFVSVVSASFYQFPMVSVDLVESADLQLFLLVSIDLCWFPVASVGLE